MPKVAHQKSTANIILNGKIIELISSKKQNKTSMCVFNTTVQQRIEFPAIVVREKKKRERERKASNVVIFRLKKNHHMPIIMSSTYVRSIDKL